MEIGLIRKDTVLNKLNVLRENTKVSSKGSVIRKSARLECIDEVKALIEEIEEETTMQTGPVVVTGKPLLNAQVLALKKAQEETQEEDEEPEEDWLNEIETLTVKKESFIEPIFMGSQVGTTRYYCTNCHGQVGKKNMFCKHCGAKFEDEILEHKNTTWNTETKQLHYSTEK